MLPQIEWMASADVPILLYLSEHRWRIVAPPATVSVNTGLSNTHANRRLKILNDAGLVETVDEKVGKQGYYRITDLGERFIMGQVDAEELEGLDPEP